MADKELITKACEKWLKSHDKTDCLLLSYEAVQELLSALKEQEAVEPYHVNTNHEQHWKCGNCNAVISVQDKYCSTCGKPILWEGR